MSEVLVRPFRWPEEEASLALLRGLGFRELTRTARGWHHRPGPAP
jgi:hypothetical protein